MVIVVNVGIKIVTDVIVYRMLFIGVGMQREVGRRIGRDKGYKTRIAIITLALINILECMFVLAYRISYELDEHAAGIIIVLFLKVVDPFVKLLTFTGFLAIFITTA